MEFSDRVIAWQRRHGRHDLPWQGTRDPYRIWLSEIMLQQTQVATVTPYYLRFIELFPDVRALAVAPINAVMAAWAGLGYYSRARNLHRCAQQVVERHGGRFPRLAEALSELPGIGRSTAAAIAVFAFGARAAILDGNVKRVFARHFGIEGHTGSAATQRVLWSVAAAQLPASEIEAYTQGLMDLGATICARRPRCDACPVQATCVAARDDRVAELPAARPARDRPVREVTLALIADEQGTLLLERRVPSGIWGGLLSAPEFEAGLADEALEHAIGRRFGLRASVVQHGAPVRHEFTHFSFILHPRVVRAETAFAVSEGANVTWVGAAVVQGAGLPAPIRRIVRSLLQPASEAATT